ncbi:hypothetical protein [Croceivirga thetidis]|uniref:LysM domain-containing protein n=1 Tax=Croceivirga thetidis TaxID=2721623 RepID=A0ABX1GPR6_9FLAO|nr:hypothetical protein [Croceivirga thetidis]NKI31668.1 hypothetical protein [Croceivirga thetidis]
MRLLLPLLLCLGSAVLAIGQTENDTVVAKQGDGIFSVLRNQGLDPVKYYPAFIELNIENLKNGSEMVLGETYIIPKAPDSYKDMGIAVDVENAIETPIFEEELADFENKGDKLENAVIYLMASSSNSSASSDQSQLKKDVLKSVAKQLLLNGAKVYLLQGTDEVTINEEESENSKDSIQVEAPMAGLDAMRNYVDVINKSFLKNSGKQKYQRLLVIDLKPGTTSEKYYKVAVFHDNNTEGERFATSMQQIFNKSKILDDSKDFTAIFAQKNNLFLAKNALPPLTFIEVDATENPKIEGRIKVKPEKNWLTDVITSGIVNDYAQLEFQD